MKRVIYLSLIWLLVSCSYSPILDENDKYLATPKETIDKDIEDCTARAENYLKGRKLKRAGKEAVRGGAVGAVTGAVYGAFTGDFDQVVEGVATGAAVGGILGAGSVAGEGKVSPDKIKQRYVNNCLSRKGYVVLGWE